MSFSKVEFDLQMTERKEWIDQILHDYFEQLTVLPSVGMNELKKSMEYSILRGGKRFRPVLCMLMAEGFGVSPQRVLPLACAVEMIHTYSLIHDDLPCMDDDDLRRGESTNHKVFGESTALLAGDALLTEAFSVLGNSFANESHIAIQLVQLLSRAAGLHGMVGGQAIDMKAAEQTLSVQELQQMHELKTGALIRVCCDGVSIICGLSEQKKELCTNFGSAIGFAFQLADDILDSTDEQLEKGSIPHAIGIEKTKEFLVQVSNSAHQYLYELGIKSGLLHDLVEYNRFRLK